MASSEETTTAGSPNYGENGTAVREMNEALRELHQVEILQIGNASHPSATVLSVPAGREIQSIKGLLDEYREKPERRKGTAKAFTLDSLIGLVNRFKNAASVVFTNPDNTNTDPNTKRPSLTAVFDYYPPTAGDQRPTDWQEHRAVYEPKLSTEWKAWMGQNGKFLSMPDFGHFLEERAVDLIVPHFDDPKLKTFADLVQGRFAEPHQLVQLARSFEVNVDVKAKNAVRLASGEIQMTWDETHRDGQGEPIKVPNLFVICIPVFYAGALYRIAARLRYRVAQGVVTWAYELVQPELAFNSAFDEMGKKVEESTAVAVYVGAPEQ